MNNCITNQKVNGLNSKILCNNLFSATFLSLKGKIKVKLNVSMLDFDDYIYFDYICLTAKLKF